MQGDKETITWLGMFFELQDRGFGPFPYKPIKACLERLSSVLVYFRPFFNISSMLFPVGMISLVFTKY